jgi:hypothetical protein
LVVFVWGHGSYSEFFILSGRIHDRCLHLLPHACLYFSRLRIRGGAWNYSLPHPFFFAGGGGLGIGLIFGYTIVHILLF